MSNLFRRFSSLGQHPATTVEQESPPFSTTEESTKEGGLTSGHNGVDHEHAADKIVKPGELTFEEDTAGGLGRHLGLFSTTFLM